MKTATATPIDDGRLARLQEENDRLRAYLARVLRVLETRTDDAEAQRERTIQLAERLPGDLEAIASRILAVERDLAQIEQHVETLLWRMGEADLMVAAAR